jgi:glycogenin
MKTYATIITTDDYLRGALTLHKSLVLTKSRYDLLVMLTKNISTTCERALDHTGIKTLRLERDLAMGEGGKARNTRSGYHHWNNTLSKLLIFDLVQYEKIVFLDSDMLVLQNLDHLFELPHLSAVAADQLKDGHQHWMQLNSGLMVVQPKSGLAESIMSHYSELEDRKKRFGDQDLIQAHYSDWPKRSELHLDQKYNVIVFSLDTYVNRHGYNVNWKTPDSRTIAAVHFSGPKKPWNLSGGAQLKSVLKESLRFRFVSANLLCQYLLISNSVRIQERDFSDDAFEYVLRLLRDSHEYIGCRCGKLGVSKRLTQRRRGKFLAFLLWPWLITWAIILFSIEHVLPRRAWVSGM